MPQYTLESQILQYITISTSIMLAILIHTHFQQKFNVFYFLKMDDMDDTIWTGTGNSESVNLWSEKALQIQSEH